MPRCRMQLLPPPHLGSALRSCTQRSSRRALAASSSSFMPWPATWLSRSSGGRWLSQLEQRSSRRRPGRSCCWYRPAAAGGGGGAFGGVRGCRLGRAHILPRAAHWSGAAGPPGRCGAPSLACCRTRGHRPGPACSARASTAPAWPRLRAQQRWCVLGGSRARWRQAPGAQAAGPQAQLPRPSTDRTDSAVDQSQAGACKRLSCHARPACDPDAPCSGSEPRSSA
jgi:hypothetical protein